jgi:hypothetical protein
MESVTQSHGTKTARKDMCCFKRKPIKHDFIFKNCGT